MNKSFYTALLIITIFASIFIPNALAEDNRPFLSILDAKEKGMFNIGPAVGDVVSKKEESAGKEVLVFDYSIFKGGIIGVWTKTFPARLNAGTVDAVRVGLKPQKDEQIDQISVKLEIKGSKDMQSVPLRLKKGWNYIKEAVNWNTIGELREVVFVVSPMAVNPTAGDPMWWFTNTESGTVGTSKKTDGILYLDLDFYKLTFLQKYFTFIKYALVFILALILGLVAVILSELFKKKHGAAIKKGRDLLYSIAVVSIIGISMAAFSIGSIRLLDAGISFEFLVIGLLGALITEIIKRSLTGRHLTPLEVFQDIVLTGILAAASSRQAVLQPPSSWVHILMFSNLIAAITLFIYHVSNLCSISSSGKHLKLVTGALITVTPYLFNWLLLLENVSIPHMLGNIVTINLLSAWPAISEIVGRLVIIFIFNEVVTNMISIAIDGRVLKTAKAHLFTFFVSLAISVSPDIADLGSTKMIVSLPVLIRAAASIITTMLSYAGLWGEVYLITGMILDGIKHVAPSREAVSKNIITGMRKGMAYSGILVAFMYALKMLLDAHAIQTLAKTFPLLAGIVAGALVFPLLKTIIETYDGSLPFFQRTRYSYRDGALYIRGAVAGFGFAYMASAGFIQKAMSERILFGFITGLVASGGVSILRDIYYAIRGQGKIQSWRLYFTDSIFGAFVGSALAFYIDTLQVPVVIEKFKLYMSSGLSPADYVTYPLVNKWGRVNLGTYSGGSKLLFIESLAGVINWSIAAWLFAINKVFMQAFFDKDKTPIKFFFSKAGFAQLMEHMLYVLRWGLWMSPIIFTFLRMMPNPTWYNQDGAIRTVFAIYNNITMSPQAFNAWSLNLFVYLLVSDFFRVLIWMDHMGLRVATLVNLSFLGMDKFDEKISRFIGPAVAQRYIPEGVKRFATWAPLLIPFYLPRGKDWDYAWSTSEGIQSASNGSGLVANINSLGLPEKIILICLAIFVFTALSFVIRALGRRLKARRTKTYELNNGEYKVTVKDTGEVYSEAIYKEHDVSRRSYDIIDPCGRILYIVDPSENQEAKNRYWPVVGNFPNKQFEPSKVEKIDDTIIFSNTNNGVRTSVEIKLPDEDDTAEMWTIRLENTTEKPKQLKVVPYLEWVLNRALDDRFHTQYARLYPEMEYLSESNAMLSWQKSTKAAGILASDLQAEGILTSRVDFIGRAQSIWSPRVLETLNFLPARDTSPCPTFDPIGSLMLGVSIDPKSSKTIRLLIGYSKNKKAAVELVNKHLKTKGTKVPESKKKRIPLIGHGEIPSGTPQPYFKFADNGNKLIVNTPYTPRPYDHALSNTVHSMMVTNRGLHTSSNGNSQQNRLTPDWPDIATKEIPTEAIYLYETDSNNWYSPTYHPLNDKNAKYESEFGVDGTAIFRMTRGAVSTELKVFVPPEEPVGIYLLTIKNNADKPVKMRVAPYFEMTLAFQPERSGPLQTKRDKDTGALLFENCRNIFRSGWAFVSMSLPAQRFETKRGRFFGSGRGVTNPYMVEKGESDKTQFTDDRAVASFLGTVEISAHGEYTVAVILGQTDSKKEARQIIHKYKDAEAAKKSLEDTKKWWNNMMGTLVVETNKPEFDCYQNWLKYQAIAERIWARRGFYQTSGAYGFRDQLQDTVNLIWVDPSLARKQLILHASQQFIEGDVFHWFFTLTDGRTSFSCRSHASDNPVWLAWGVVEYIRATGDQSILDEMTSYVVSEFPFAPLPKNKQGWGHLYHRTTRADSVYKHCMRSINLLLKKRSGKHGLPLMGVGDWNDGLDEIGSEGKGEIIWLGFFLYYILKGMVDIIEMKEDKRRKEYYVKRMHMLKDALEDTWRGDRYLRAYHDNGAEIGIKDSGIWEIDALTAAWAVIAGMDFERGVTIFNTALSILEKDNAILLGWPALREDSKPYLGRSSKYPEGVRENGMYCHGVQWLIRAARIIAEEFDKKGDHDKANEYRATAYRLWLKISAIPHMSAQEIEIYGGQPNKQAADLLTNFDPGRMIWHGYTGAAGWMLRQALEGVIGASVIKNELIMPDDIDKPRGDLKIKRVYRDVTKTLR
jgi:cyclic beta-1,2-glucan synthetase